MIKVTGVIIGVCVMAASPVFAGDPMLDLRRGHPPAVKGTQPKEAVEGCPEGWECASVAAFVKPSYKAEAKKIAVGHLTAGKAWSRIVVTQHIGEQHGVIVNTVKVRQGGKWIPYAQGIRLAEGRTELAVPLPAGTPEIVLSFDHGRGADVKVSLERPLQ